MATVSLARRAMATRFEIVLHGHDPVALRAAGEEALDEIDRLDGQLSLYRPTSEIARLNARAAAEPVRVEPQLFALLQRAQQLSAATGGAFDLTIAPLLRCWGLMGGNTGRVPAEAELAAALACVGMHQVQFDEQAFTVRFARAGLMLDLGSVGKGHALERAAGILREAGVCSALLHGGTSTVCALGAPPEAADWKVAIEKPVAAADARLSRWNQPAQAGPADPLLAVIPLRDESLSVSAVWGKSFTAGGRTYGHVIDPRTGRPVDRAWLAAVALPSATESDALSTALLTLGAEGIDAMARLRPDARLLVVAPGDRPGAVQVASRGIEASTV